MNYKNNALFLFIKFTARILRPLGLQHNRLIKKIYNLLLQKSKPRIVTIFENKIILDRFDSLRLSIKDEHEPYLTSLFKKYVKKNNIVFDLGAHIGYHTLIAAKLVGGGGKVFAFEPNKYFFNLLVKNAQINSLQNIIAVNKAILNKSGDYYLSLAKGSDLEYILTKQKISEQAIRLRTISLDDYFGRKSIKINIIKMDIEGSEIKALIGMKKLLSRQKKLILFIEFWPKGLKRMGNNSLEFINLLKNLGFQINEIDEDRKTLIPIDQNNLIQLFKNYSVENARHVNLLCIKST